MAPPWIEDFNFSLKNACRFDIKINNREKCFGIAYKMGWEAHMGVSYKKLWKLLIDREMSKTDLIKKAGISTNAMAHMGKNEDVRVEVLAKICCALDCTMNDIMDVIPDEK